MTTIIYYRAADGSKRLDIEKWKKSEDSFFFITKI